MTTKELDFKNKVLYISSITEEYYKNFDLDRLAAYALFLLEKNKVPLYFDYITVALFRLFPKKFAMANFEQYPDTNRISKSLRRLADHIRKNWANGNIENGFSLTEAGREIALRVEESLLNPKKQIKQIAPIVTRTRGRSPKDDVNDVIKSDLYQRWIKHDKSMTNYEVLSFLRAVPYTPKPLLLKNLENLKLSASSTKNKSAVNFLEWLENNFHQLFN
ncbi:MAG: hypothetical protein PHH01_00070 [Patescibacteria group bacterium]|nr:hypothetical protein [Patescibacteria group bacterium]